MCKSIQKILFSIIIVLSLGMAGCAEGNIPTEPTPTMLPTETAVSLPPTPTSLPMAIRVNGEGILLTDYQEEFARLESALETLGRTLTPEEISSKVLEELIGTELLNQEAKKNGFSLSEEGISSHIEELIQSMGGVDEFNSWKQSMGYSDESFRRFIARSMGAAWQRDKIIESLPPTAEQVHARQIFFSREESANNYKRNIEAGADFEALAREADPITRGDLGWFPRGYLLQPEVEEAAFRLSPGEVSEVIQSEIGFHLVQVIEKDTARKLDADAKPGIQQKAIADWVLQAKENSQIDILVP